MTGKKDFRILCLDGGGGKGLYTLGVLNEVESLLKKPLCENFDLIYGTSTGAIIAAALAFGKSIGSIEAFYLDKLSKIMKRFTAAKRSEELRLALKEVFEEQKFNSVKTDVAIVATNFDEKRPFIFKSAVKFAHGLKPTFVPGFGASIAEAVEASCSAYPFFQIKKIETANQGVVRLVDGGFCANNPSILALADVVHGLGVSPENVKFLSVGVGNYPARYPLYAYLQGARIYPALTLISTQFGASSNSIEKVFNILAQKTQVVRVNDAFSDSALATSLFEYDRTRLLRLKTKGRESFAGKEQEIKNLLGI